MELSNIELTFVPLVNPVPTLLSINKITLIKRSRTIYLPCLPLRQVIHPVAFVKHLWSRKLPVPIGLVVLYSSFVKNSLIFNE